MTETAKRVRVTGLVQGVGFRAWTMERASRLGLVGWVRNETDGSVAAVISGDAGQVERMLEDLRQGPAGSEVSHVSVEEAADPAETSFEIRI